MQDLCKDYKQKVSTSSKVRPARHRLTHSSHAESDYLCLGTTLELGAAPHLLMSLAPYLQ
jgi:hypothetical protein